MKELEDQSVHVQQVNGEADAAHHSLLEAGLCFLHQEQLHDDGLLLRVHHPTVHLEPVHQVRRPATGRRSVSSPYKQQDIFICCDVRAKNTAIASGH